MIYNGNPYWNGWFGGTTIFGNTHFFLVECWCFFCLGGFNYIWYMYIYICLFFALFGEGSHFDYFEFWLICFKGVETTNQLFVDAFFYGIHHWRDIFFCCGTFLSKSEAKRSSWQVTDLFWWISSTTGWMVSHMILCSTKNWLIFLKLVQPPTRLDGLNITWLGITIKHWLNIFSNSLVWIGWFELSQKWSLGIE